ncbi:hypothetical protein WS71_14340 [Burkholderia mayonis]|uniref:Uncharacterized protein n=1 Tax=Burkholderia mayonis TaxID=1385591 RepID=A0A1B4FY74_9BURK|nr:hypothetical protein WS71_14340 [Burkholderia mayonis]KVE48929.1 hypothetical protein WS71_17610 [Burkholderia mayonis]
MRRSHARGARRRADAAARVRLAAVADRCRAAGAACATFAADLVAGHEPEIDLDGLTPIED